MKTILNRFIECGLVSLFNWDNFSWLFEKNCFFLFLTQHFDLKNKKILKVIKSGFLWLIRAPDSQFSGYRVFEGQNWMKIVVFCIFEFWPYMVLISVNTTTKIVKKWFRSLKKPVGLFQKLACNPHLTRHRCFYWSLFHPICLKTIFYIFPLFQSAEKRVFSNFLELGTFYGFGHQNHSEQVQK